MVTISGVVLGGIISSLITNVTMLFSTFSYFDVNQVAHEEWCTTWFYSFLAEVNTMFMLCLQTAAAIE